MTRGADGVARTFSGRAKGAEAALIDGDPGLVWMAGPRPRVVFRFTIDDGKVTAIDLVADPSTLEALELA